MLIDYPTGSYAERAYFDGDYCQHVAAWIERDRLLRRSSECRAAARARRA